MDIFERIHGLPHALFQLSKAGLVKTKQQIDIKNDNYDGIRERLRLKEMMNE